MHRQYLTIPRFITSTMLTMVNRCITYSRITLPDHPGYTFLKKTDAVYFRPSGMVGIYADAHGQKYVIKDYPYRLKDLDYEYLQNEITTLRSLNSIQNTASHVGVVPLVYSNDESGVITIITKYVDGNTIGELPEKLVIQILKDVLNYLRTASVNMSSEYYMTIPIRAINLMYLFPYYLFRAIIKNPKNYRMFIQSLLLYSKFFPIVSDSSDEYCLAHRDLSADNIIYNETTGDSTILDTECMVRTDLLHDLSSLPRLYFGKLSSDALCTLYDSFGLSKSHTKRLIVSILVNCIVKIATETKNSRDFNNAVNALDMTIYRIIPHLILTL